MSALEMSKLYKQIIAKNRKSVLTTWSNLKLQRSARPLQRSTSFTSRFVKDWLMAQVVFVSATVQLMLTVKSNNASACIRGRAFTTSNSRIIGAAKKANA
jgi:hypothetical protein